MRKQIVPVLLLAIAGCSAAYKEQTLSQDHPANPQASAVHAVPRSRVLDLDHAEPVMVEATTHQSQPVGHQGMVTNDMAHDQMQNSSAAGDREPPPSSGASIYFCPMHPEVTSDKPNQRCPKCGMKLVPKEGDEK